jgi:zinc/manganese transport system substrate-binding protein
MAGVVDGIGAFLTAEVTDLDAASLEAAVESYGAELAALDAEVEALVDTIPEDQRILVTNHEVFGYFADRYGFEVVGAVIPSGTTAESVSAGELAELADVLRNEGVSAIFADISASTALADTLAAEVGEVAVVQLFTESLGEPDSGGGTYLEMVRSNAQLITDALT